MKIGTRLVTRWGVLGLLVSGVVAAVLVVGRAAQATAAATSVPEVIGPIPSTAAPGDPSHNYVFYSTPMDLPHRFGAMDRPLPELAA
jgi:hypothetical protein